MNPLLLSFALLAGNQAVEPVQTLTIDASDKENFQYYALNEGQLEAVSEADNWIFAVRRYIFKTHTGSNGSFAGGAYLVDAKQSYDAFPGCDGKLFEVDQDVTMLGFSISANVTLTQWFEYNDLGAPAPIDQFYAIGRDSECLKFKILSYTKGVYEVQYEQLIPPATSPIEALPAEVAP